MLRRVPVSLINLPNKDYWLAPERKQESLRSLERDLEWMGVLTVGFLTLVMHFAIRANLVPQPKLENGPFLVLLGAFLIAAFGWLARLYRRFRDPRK